MLSQKRILAARANGARSRGPKTQEGKARSSRNAIRHCLLSKCVLLTHESREAFQALYDLYTERFEPLDNVELGFVEEMVSACWRLRRTWAIEARMLDNATDSQPPGKELTRIAAAFGELAAGPQLGLLHRYETRIHMMHQRALHNLAALRHPALRNEPKNSPVFNKFAEIEAAYEPTTPANEPTTPTNEPMETL